MSQEYLAKAGGNIVRQIERMSLDAGRYPEILVKIEQGEFATENRSEVVNKQGKEKSSVVILQEKIRMAQLYHPQHGQCQQGEKERIAVVRDYLKYTLHHQ
jgi:hypothetical protein